MNEPILGDDYPVFVSYFYVVDGQPVRSPFEGTVRDLKTYFRARVIRRCDAVERGLL